MFEVHESRCGIRRPGYRFFLEPLLDMLFREDSVAKLVGSLSTELPSDGHVSLNTVPSSLSLRILCVDLRFCQEPDTGEDTSDAGDSAVFVVVLSPLLFAPATKSFGSQAAGRPITVPSLSVPLSLLPPTVDSVSVSSIIVLSGRPRPCRGGDEYTAADRIVDIFARSSLRARCSS